LSGLRRTEDEDGDIAPPPSFDLDIIIPDDAYGSALGGQVPCNFAPGPTVGDVYDVNRGDAKDHAQRRDVAVADVPWSRVPHTGERDERSYKQLRVTEHHLG
jgi:hypothetical protein